MYWKFPVRLKRASRAGGAGRGIVKGKFTLIKVKKTLLQAQGREEKKTSKEGESIYRRRTDERPDGEARDAEMRHQDFRKYRRTEREMRCTRAGLVRYNGNLKLSLGEHLHPRPAGAVQFKSHSSEISLTPDYLTPTNPNPRHGA